MIERRNLTALRNSEELFRHAGDKSMAHNIIRAGSGSLILKAWLLIVGDVEQVSFSLSSIRDDGRRASYWQTGTRNAASKTFLIAIIGRTLHNLLLLLLHLLLHLNLGSKTLAMVIGADHQQWMKESRGSVEQQQQLGLSVPGWIINGGARAGAGGGGGRGEGGEGGRVGGVGVGSAQLHAIPRGRVTSPAQCTNILHCWWWLLNRATRKRKWPFLTYP